MRSFSFLKQPCHKAHLVISSSLTYGTPSTISLPVSQVSSCEIAQFLHHHGHPSLQPLCPPATNLLSLLHSRLYKGGGHKWSDESDTAFSHLEALFTATSILTRPDPSCHFMDEVDLGNRELLAVVLALQKWRHWLEWSIQPFVGWTDHKNLSYLQIAKCLTSRQAWPTLYVHFGHFVFLLKYHLQHQDGCPVLSVFPWSCKLRAWSHPVSLLHHGGHFLTSGSRGYWRCNEKLCLLAMPPHPTSVLSLILSTQMSCSIPPGLSTTGELLRWILLPVSHP